MNTRTCARAIIAAVWLLGCGLGTIPEAAGANNDAHNHDVHKRMVIIDQDAFGPAGSNLQAILMLLQASDVEVLGITIVSGDGWRDEEVDHTLRLLEIAERPDVPVIPGAVLPLVNSAARTIAWERLYGKLIYKGAWMETWPVQGVVRRTPHPSDPYFVPPSPAGAPHIKAAVDTAANFLIRELRRHPGQVTPAAARQVAGPLSRQRAFDHGNCPVIDHHAHVIGG